MGALYKSPFKKFVKKQSRPFQLAIEDEIETICTNPTIGEGKRGDLSGFRVHKFVFKRQEYLVAYSIRSENIIFYMLDTHENFYKALKRYIKEAN